MTKAEASPQLEGYKARDIEVLLLTDPVDSFWVRTVMDRFARQPAREPVSLIHTAFGEYRIDRTAAGTRTNVATASASNAPQVRDSARTRIITVSGRIRIPIVTG